MLPFYTLRTNSTHTRGKRWLYSLGFGAKLFGALMSSETPVPTRRTLGQMVKQAGLLASFEITMTFRRLRRRVWTWSLIRLGVAAAATGLIWRYRHAGAGLASLIGGLALFAFALFFRTRHDPLADDLGALMVLNGGTFRQTPDAPPVPRSRIFVQPEQFTVVGESEDLLLGVPLAKVQKLAAHPAAGADPGAKNPWQVEVNWTDEDPCTTTFEYDGVFAEHLARVTESTLRSQWKKGLPIAP